MYEITCTLQAAYTHCPCITVTQNLRTCSCCNPFDRYRISHVTLSGEVGRSALRLHCILTCISGEINV